MFLPEASSTEMLPEKPKNLQKICFQIRKRVMASGSRNVTSYVSKNTYPEALSLPNYKKKAALWHWKVGGCTPLSQDCVILALYVGSDSCGKMWEHEGQHGFGKQAVLTALAPPWVLKKGLG